MIAECICVRSTGEIVTDGGRLSASGCAPHTQHGLFWNPILLAHAVRCLNQGTNSTFFFHDPTAPSWSWPPRYRGFTMTHTHAHTHTHSFGILWTNNQPEAETSTRQHITLTTDSHPCPRRNSNLHSQQASGRRPTP